MVHEEIVKILLGEEEVNADRPCDDGGPPLWYAAVGGREGVVKLLPEGEGRSGQVR